MLLHDFSFRSPEEILAGLRKSTEGAVSGSGYPPNLLAESHVYVHFTPAKLGGPELTYRFPYISVYFRIFNLLIE